MKNSFLFFYITKKKKEERRLNNNVAKQSVASNYAKTYTTFSGHDMVCIFEVPISGKLKYISKVVGSLQTVTYSIHDEKTPVRCLGDMNAKGYVYGKRTIAGTLIFTVFNKHWAHEIMEEYLKTYNINAHFLVDELPPINITISCANEYGQNARLALYGVTFVNEGQVLSINDNFTENTFQFYATDVDYLSNIPRGVGTDFNKKPTDNLPTISDKEANKNEIITNKSDSTVSSNTTQSNNENTTTEDSDPSQNMNTYVFFYEIKDKLNNIFRLSKTLTKKQATDLLNNLNARRNECNDEIAKKYLNKELTVEERMFQKERLNNEYRKLEQTINENTERQD